MTEEGQNKRLLARHGSDEAGINAANMMRKVFDMYEPAGADEGNTYNVVIEVDMTIDDVMNEILKIIGRI